MFFLGRERGGEGLAKPFSCMLGNKIRRMWLPMGVSIFVESIAKQSGYLLSLKGTRVFTLTASPPAEELHNNQGAGGYSSDFQHRDEARWCTSGSSCLTISKRL